MVIIVWQFVLQLPMQSETLPRWDILDTTLCDKVCQWLATGLWFSMGTSVSYNNKTDRHDIAEILLKVALNIITPKQLYGPMRNNKLIRTWFFYIKKK
jgi:hypothetical protein